MASAQNALILSDNYLFSEGLKSFLSSDFEWEKVSFATTYSEFERLVQEEKPNLVIVDHSCEVFKLEKVIAYIDFVCPAGILLFSNDITQEYLTQIKQYGLEGIVKKSAKREELLNCFKGLNSGEFFLGENVLRLDENKVSLVESLKISDREQEIIQLIAQGYINKEIADKLFLSTHTVNTHRKNIMQKLSINNTAGIVVFAVKEGIVSPSEFLFQ